MPFFILSLLVQVALVVHIVKSGRNTMWIWIVLMLPLAGSLAYLIVEVLPELMGGKTARGIRRNLESAINPYKGVKSAAYDLAISDTVENSMRLADECLNKEMYTEARELYTKSLRGVHENDPVLMYGLAQAEFGLKNYTQAKKVLDELITQNPDYKNPAAHLLFARTAEELHDLDLALQEYEVLDGYYSGPEATYRYAALLKRTGKQEKAKTLFEKIVHLSRISGKHYNALHREWISMAKSECRG